MFQNQIKNKLNIQCTVEQWNNIIYNVRCGETQDANNKGIIFLVVIAYKENIAKNICCWGLNTGL
jgi:hypothetical protein